MSRELGELSLEDAAKQAAGNWQEFHCFAWWRKDDLPDADKWAIIYTHNRDSGLLDQSNATIIEKTLQPFTQGNNPHIVIESHSHWAVGHVDGFSIRVYKRGKITKAFREYHKLAKRLDDYPILDEEDYSNREYEASFENIADAAWRLKNEYDLPEDWQSAVYSWFADNDYSAIENVDDQGGYPSEEQLKEAFRALGYQEMAAV
jgi:hypothetical protein